MKYIIFLVFTLLHSIMFSQQGVASYYEHIKLDIKIDSTQPGFNASMNEKMMENLKKQFESEYTLNFNARESVYKKEPKLTPPQPQGTQVVIVSSQSASDVLYKNIQQNRFTNQTDLMGKTFLIQDTLFKRDWKLTNETKNIGEYTCYKATYTYSRDSKNFTIGTDGSPTETVKKEEIVITAWYTPQIPVSNGPDDYQGLPGLIMEIHDGKRTLVCNKITLSQDGNFKIEAPDNGKKVTQKEYEEISEKKMKEFINQNSGGKRRDDGNTISISIGG